MWDVPRAVSGAERASLSAGPAPADLHRLHFLGGGAPPGSLLPVEGELDS